MPHYRNTIALGIRVGPKGKCSNPALISNCYDVAEVVNI